MALINQLKRDEFLNGTHFEIEVNGKIVFLKYLKSEKEFEFGSITRYDGSSISNYCTVEMVCLNHFKWVAQGPFGSLIKGRTYFNKCMAVKN